MQKPSGNEYPQNKYFSYYVEQVDYQNVIEALTVNKDVVLNLFKSLSEEQKKFRYAEGKWSPHEIFDFFSTKILHCPKKHLLLYHNSTTKK